MPTKADNKDMETEPLKNLHGTTADGVPAAEVRHLFWSTCGEVGEFPIPRGLNCAVIDVELYYSTRTAANNNAIDYLRQAISEKEGELRLLQTKLTRIETDNAPFLKSSPGGKVEKIGNIRI